MAVNTQSSIGILCSSHNGIYIPQLMGERLKAANWEGIDQDELKDLENPENENYWETWDRVLCNATLTDENGRLWRLHHDGDLFCYCDELMTEEDTKNLFGEC